MYPPSHFLFAFLIAEIFVKFGMLSHEIAILVALIAVLIDIDHFIYYAAKHRDLSLRNAWNAAVVKHEKGERTFVHHFWGFLIVTLFLIGMWFVNLTTFFVIGISYYSHMLLDDGFFVGKTVDIKEEGFVIKYPLYEFIFDVVIVAGIVGLFLF